MEKIKELLAKYREQIVYLFVGGVTTLIGTAIYELLVFYDVSVVAANVISWCFAVIWAFYGNKKLVFQDKETAPAKVARQFLEFAAARLFSLGVDTLLVWLGTEKLGISKYFVKIPVAVIVVILNYITGKLIVFAKKDK